MRTRELKLILSSSCALQVTEVEYTDTNVIVRTADGAVLRARRAVVTLPLGILKAGEVTFSPELPARKLAAIKHLEMGVLDKVRFELIASRGVTVSFQIHGAHDAGMGLNISGKVSFDAVAKWDPKIGTLPMKASRNNIQALWRGSRAVIQ